MASSEHSSGAVRDRIAGLKNDLAEMMLAQRKVEVERQGLESQRDSLGSQFTDYNSRIASLEEACNGYNAELKLLERDRKVEESATEGYEKQKGILEDEIDRLKKLVSGAQTRRKTLSQELAATTQNANAARDEMTKTQEEVAGIINILQVLTENITFTIEQIKGDIQHGNQEALEEASAEFHGYVSDVTQMLGTIDSVGVEDLASFTKNIQMFIENADESVNHIMTRIQENADNAVHNSSEEFDGFMRDLVEIVNNTRLTLKKLQVADLGNVYDAVNSIRSNLDSQLDSLLENQSVLAVKEVQSETIKKEIGRRKKVLEENNSRTKNLLQKNKLKMDLRDTIKGNLENVAKQKGKLDESLAKLKADMSARWDHIKEVVDAIEQAQNNLFDLKVAKITPKMVPLEEQEKFAKKSSAPVSHVPEISAESEVPAVSETPQPQLKAGTTLLKLTKKVPLIESQPAATSAASPSLAKGKPTAVKAPAKPAVKVPSAAIDAGPGETTPIAKPAEVKPAPAKVPTKNIAKKPAAALAASPAEATPVVKPATVKPAPAKVPAKIVAKKPATAPAEIKPTTKPAAVKTPLAKVPAKKVGKKPPAEPPAAPTGVAPVLKSPAIKVPAISVAKKAAAKVPVPKAVKEPEIPTPEVKQPAKKSAKKAAKKG